jgi:hypothetical protein
MEENFAQFFSKVKNILLATATCFETKISLNKSSKQKAFPCFKCLFFSDLDPKILTTSKYLIKKSTPLII